MVHEEPSLQGWVPEIGRDATIEEVIDQAFDYRGDVTIETAEGPEITGYLYNRDASARPPFVQLFESGSGEPLTLHYEQVRNIRFTGRDMAAGQSYEAWKARKEAARHQEASGVVGREKTEETREE